MIQMQVRPLGAWPGGKRTEAWRRKDAPFRRNVRVPVNGGGSYSRSEKLTVTDTLDLLQRELEMLGARRVVIEAGFREGDIRQDGWPKASARAPGDPGVVLRIVESRFGALTYPCDTFTSWDDNLRAIALALEALRKVDRYGVTKSGEQYAGWKALPSSTEGGGLTDEAAAKTLAAYSDQPWQFILNDPAVRDHAIRQALFKAHPDHGGTSEAFQRVHAARKHLIQGAPV